MSIVIFDNRLCNFSSVECEAGTSTYRKLVSEWIVKQFINVRSCRVLPHPVFAALPSRVDAAEVGEVSPGDRAFARSALTGALECCCAPQVLALQTFGGFALDALNKFVLMAEKRGVSTSSRLSVVVFTTDVNMFSTADKAGIEQGAATFTNRLKELMASSRSIDVSIVCVIVSSPPGSGGSQHRAMVMSRVRAAFPGCTSHPAVERNNRIRSDSRIGNSRFGALKPIYVSVIENSAPYFASEMTRWLSSALLPGCADLLMPRVGSTQANVMLQLCGVDLSSHEWMEVSLYPTRGASRRRSQLETVARVPRGGVDPLHLRGVCLIALPSSPADTGDARYAENYRIYCSIVAALAASDSILIVALSTDTSPRDPQQQAVSRSGGHEVKDMLALVPPDTATVERERAEGRCPHMVLMLLRDRESVLHQYPFESLIHTHPSAPRKRRGVGVGLEAESEAQQQHHCQRQLDDHHGDEAEEEQEEEEYGEFALLCVQETPLEHHYNPIDHPSGRVDLQVQDVIEAITHGPVPPAKNTHPSNGGPTIPPQHYSGPPSLTSALPSTLPYSSASSAQHRTAPSTVGATAASSSVTKGGISIVEARPGPGGAHARGGTSRKRTPK